MPLCGYIDILVLLPNPNAPCVAVRSHTGVRRKLSDRLSDQVDGINGKEYVNGTDSEQLVDSKVTKEMEELAKIKDSGAAKVILEDLRKRQQEKSVLDPRSSSRTPSAATEPSYKPRYESPLFACLYFTLF